MFVFLVIIFGVYRNDKLCLNVLINNITLFFSRLL